MSDGGLDPFWKLEALTWSKGAVYHQEADAYFTPATNDGVSGGSAFQKTYRLPENPLPVFRELANAGSAYDLEVCTRGRMQGLCLVAIPKQDGEGKDAPLLDFMESYGLPVDAHAAPMMRNGQRQAAIPPMVRLDYALSKRTSKLRQDPIGGADAGLRVTAAVAHLCWTLWDLLQREEWDELTDRLSAVPENPNLQTFLPPGAPYFCAFSVPDATSTSFRLRYGVMTTCLQIAEWYVRDGLQIATAQLQGEASPPQLVLRARGLRSYLWLHFARKLEGRGIPKFYTLTCRKDDHHKGCGEDFFSDNPKARLCESCQREQRRRETVRFTDKPGKRKGKGT